MNTSFLQPKNALQRADELCSVGQELEAFELLQRTILDRKFRYLQWDSTAQQDVVIRFLSLAVKLDRIKQCRDGLLNYRNHCQHGVSMLGPVEKVILHFRECAEKKLQEAETPAQQENAIRICIDVYRTIIDVIRSTPKLGKLYHSTVVRAHELCKEYGLRNDFRRLADLVRSNYAAIIKQKPKSTSEVDQQLLADLEELKRPEIHIETKLSQLKTAVALESWKECQLSIDELFQLGILDLATFRTRSKTSKKQQDILLNCVAQYFEFSSELFLKSGFMKLHALALYRHLMQVRNRSPERLQSLSNTAVLAILSVPIDKLQIISGGRGLGIRTLYEEEERRLANLIGYGYIPSRQELIQLVVDKKILETSSPEVIELFNEVERTIPAPDPYRVVKILKGMTVPAAEEYLRGIKLCVLRKALDSVAQIYERLSIDKFKEQFCPPEFLPWTVAEREIAASGFGGIKFDFATNVIQLNPKKTPIESRRRLTQLSSNLLRAMLVHQAPLESKRTEKTLHDIRCMLAATAADSASSRLELIKKKREEIDTMKRKLLQVREDAERERVKKLQEQEEIKIMSVKKELEEGRRARELEIAKMQLAKITAEKIKQLINLITEEEKEGSNRSMRRALEKTPLWQLDEQKLLSSKLTSREFTEIVQKLMDDKFEEKRQQARLFYKRHDHLARAIRAKKVEIVETDLAAQTVKAVEALKQNAEEERREFADILKKRYEVLSVYQDRILKFFQE